MTLSRTTVALLAASLFGLQACQSPAEQAAPSDNNPTLAEAPANPVAENASVQLVSADARADATTIPMDAQGLHNTNFEYLLARYDADADGSISKAEYDRSETAWGRLDKNQDGAISGADFESDRRGGGRTRFVAQRMIAKYFQGSGDNPTPDEVTLEEVQDTFEAYDLDHNGSLAKDEFTCAYEDLEQPIAGDEMYSRMIGDIDVWDSIVQGTDADEDGLLASAELDEFFKSSAGDDGVWTFTEPQRRGGQRGKRESAEPSEPTDGAMQGELAPDFTLSSPDGSQTVTLSSFKGSKPVALIFGSYT